jgi:hypothetical protein
VSDTLGLVVAIIGIVGSVVMVAGLIYVSASGDHEREEEDRARAFFDEHGHWPDEA